MKPKFNIDDTIKYNGNIYLICGIKFNEQNHIYDVKCLKNNFPDEAYVSSIGSIAEDRMEKVEYHTDWSHEDELQLTEALFAVDLEFGYKSETYKWLKSIKERIIAKKEPAIVKWARS